MSARCWDSGAGVEETFPNKTPRAGLVVGGGAGGGHGRVQGRRDLAGSVFRTASQSLKGR